MNKKPRSHRPPGKAPPRDPLQEPRGIHEHVLYAIDQELRVLVETPDDYPLVLMLQQTRTMNKMYNNGIRIRS